VLVSYFKHDDSGPAARPLPLALAALTVSAAFSTACGPSIDPITVLEPVDVVTGWYDEGIVDGKNKLVRA
jgi:hypothetical protein